jgi:hypothetical protein
MIGIFSTFISSLIQMIEVEIKNCEIFHIEANDVRKWRKIEQGGGKVRIRELGARANDMKNRQITGKCRFNASRSGSWYNREEMYGKMALRRAKERKNFYSWNHLNPVKGIETCHLPLSCQLQPSYLESPKPREGD